MLTMKSLFCAVKGWSMNNETLCHEGIWWSGSIGPYILNNGDCFITSIHSIGGLGPQISSGHSGKQKIFFSLNEHLHHGHTA